MYDQIRARILLAIDAHSREHPNAYMSDTKIVQALGTVDLTTVRQQMDILAAKGLLLTANAMDGQNALLSPQGRLALEGLRADPPPVVGF